MVREMNEGIDLQPIIEMNKKYGKEILKKKKNVSMKLNTLVYNILDIYIWKELVN